MDQAMARTKRAMEIREQIDALEKELRDLRREDIENFLAEAKSNIGRCFVSERYGHMEYAIIIDVPQEQLRMSGIDINRHQFPCVILDTYNDGDPVPFYSDTLFTRDGRNFPDWSEISQEEFNTQLLGNMSLFSRRIYKEDEGGGDS